MFWEIYVNLCSKKGESPNKVAKNLSIASGTVTEWKKGRIPQNATLKKLADYFGVSVDYLLGKDDKKVLSLDEEESEIKRELIADILAGSDDQAQLLLDIIKRMK